MRHLNCPCGGALPVSGTPGKGTGVGQTNAWVHGVGDVRGWMAPARTRGRKMRIVPSFIIAVLGWLRGERENNTRSRRQYRRLIIIHERQEQGTACRFVLIPGRCDPPISPAGRRCALVHVERNARCNEVKPHTSPYVPRLLSSTLTPWVGGLWRNMTSSSAIPDLVRNPGSTQAPHASRPCRSSLLCTCVSKVSF